MTFQIDAFIPKNPRVFQLLLIDSDPNEISVVRRTLSVSVPVRYEAEQVTTFEDGLVKLATSRYDLIVLDCKLTRTLTVPRTIPVINTLRGTTQLAVTLSDLATTQTTCPTELEVDHVLEKAGLMQFLGSLFMKMSARTVCNTCEHFRDSECSKYDRSRRHAMM
ncbi:hypothetical protein [uncultured Algimonas sp.]|uniref:hypothetical protein n=1 Tax=uncultured Algimonas sp. TaxID=1547920 RepID=UPI0026180B17|nr:hypothetical protein [uncultured Algimonas sp.]